MRYRIEDETSHRIRFRLYTSRITPEQEEIIQYAFSSIRGVRSVTVYRATCGCAICYDGDRQELLDKLTAFHYENVQMMAKPAPVHISISEMQDRKLDPALKRRLRLRVLAETAADVLLPVPLQLGYHAYQLITLRNI